MEMIGSAIATIDFAGEGWGAALAMKLRILESPNPYRHYPYNTHGPMASAAIPMITPKVGLHRP
jgi:hypothetical protein